MLGAASETPTTTSTLVPTGTVVSVALCDSTLPACAGFCLCCTFPSTRPTAVSCLTASASLRPCRFGTVAVAGVGLALGLELAVGRADGAALRDGPATGAALPLGTTSHTTTPTTMRTSAATASSHQGRRLGAGAAAPATSNRIRPLRTEPSSGAWSDEYTRPCTERWPGMA